MEVPVEVTEIIPQNESAPEQEPVPVAETAEEPVAIECETIENVAQSELTEVVSRTKQKKLLKLAKMEQIKKLKRLKERQRAKEKRAAEAAKGIPSARAMRKALKRNKVENSKNTVRVAIDFDYDELMIDKDIAKCAKQMLRVYSLNRKSSMPIRLYFTTLRSGSKMEKTLKRHDGYQNWDVKMVEDSFLKMFDRDSIVYLTSDSDNVLQEIDPNAAYIIGGLVDHNFHKGLSLQKAEENGLKTARLPLHEYIEMKTRTVLTITHVFEILLRISEGKPWKETLLEVLPQRKFNPPGYSRRHKSKEAGVADDNHEHDDDDNDDDDDDIVNDEDENIEETNDKCDEITNE